MKSVLHILNLDTVGGVEELFIQFLEQSSSFHHHVLVTGKRPHPFFQNRLDQHARSVTLEKYRFGFKLPAFLRLRQRQRALTQSLPDTIILWNRLESSSFFKTRAPQAELIYYEHGASWIESKTGPSGMDRILANSHAAKRLLELKWGLDTPISVIENPLKPTIRAAASPKKAPKETLHLGFMGRLIPLKGVSLLLHAVHELKKRQIAVTVSLAGDGEDRERLEQEVKRLAICANFLGCIKDVEKFFQEIDILVVPSIREPLGLVAQEASLSGCPVIASQVDGLPEVVQDGHTGFLLPPTLDISCYPEFGGRREKLPDLVYNPLTDSLMPPHLLDPVQIADKVQELLHRYEAFSQNAIEFAKKRPTISDYVKALEQFINA